MKTALRNSASLAGFQRVFVVSATNQNGAAPLEKLMEFFNFVVGPSLSLAKAAGIFLAGLRSGYGFRRSRGDRTKL